MIFIGADHHGQKNKQAVEGYLQSAGFAYQDVNPNQEGVVDFPDIAFKVAEHVSRTDNLGILLCGTGNGMALAANKVPGVRAAVAWDAFSAQKARQHLNANIICLPADELGYSVAVDIVEKFLAAQFDQKVNHLLRLSKIAKFEEERDG